MPRDYTLLDAYVARIGLLRLDLEEAGLMTYDDGDPVYEALVSAEDAIRDAFEARLAEEGR